MAFITANDAAALIDQDVSAEIISDLAGGGSRVLPLFKALPQMSSKQTKLRVLSALPTASFVSGATTTSEPGTKATTSAAWENVYVYAEELACIVPIPEELLDDAVADELLEELLHLQPLVLLDEPLAQVDIPTAKEIFADISPVLRKGTTIIITHNPVLIKMADKVYFIYDGKAFEGGPNV